MTCEKECLDLDPAYDEVWHLNYGQLKWQQSVNTPDSCRSLAGSRLHSAFLLCLGKGTMSLWTSQPEHRAAFQSPCALCSHGSAGRVQKLRLGPPVKTCCPWIAQFYKTQILSCRGKGGWQCTAAWACPLSGDSSVPFQDAIKHSIQDLDFRNNFASRSPFQYP